MVALILWNALALVWSRSPAVHLSYTEFIAQVEAGNVDEVTIAGDTIEGRLRQAMPLPDGPPDVTFDRFETVFPEAVGDPSLLPLLAEYGVEVDTRRPRNGFVGLILANLLPVALLVGVLVWIGRRTMQGQAGVFNFTRARARTYTTERPDVTFDDVAGCDEAKEELHQAVEFLRDPDRYHRLGARLPRGFLLVGPPGTGKTLLARAVAGEASVPFLSISASEFVEMFVGVGAGRVRDLFTQAKKMAPSIVFIDELDAVGRRRGAGLGTVNDEREQTLNQLLTEMDGFDERENVIVLSATNRPDVLDPALLRPGRFDRQVVVEMPDRRGREQILRIHTRKLVVAADVDLAELAARTTGMSGADLANIANEAALLAAARGGDAVTAADFDRALDKILLGSERHTVMTDFDRRVVAYHESGHAVVAWFSPLADPVHKVTIVPHGRALGVTSQLPEEDRVNYSRAYLMTRLAVMLGGRTSEEEFFGEVTTGAESDLVEATKLARRMVTRWGMGSFGPMALRTDEEQPFLGYEIAQGRELSEEMQAQVDRDVAAILEEAHARAKKIIDDHRTDLERLAEHLLVAETVADGALVDLLGARPGPDDPDLRAGGTVDAPG